MQDGSNKYHAAYAIFFWQSLKGLVRMICCNECGFSYKVSKGHSWAVPGQSLRARGCIVLIVFIYLFMALIGCPETERS